MTAAECGTERMVYVRRWGGCDGSGKVMAMVNLKAVVVLVVVRVVTRPVIS